MRLGRAQAFKPRFTQPLIGLTALQTAVVYGPRLPNAAASSSADGGTAWYDVTNILSLDALVAGVFIASTGASEQLRLTDFGFNVPASTSIAGIRVTLISTVSVVSGSPAPIVLTCRLIKTTAGGPRVFYKEATTTGSAADFLLGGPLDTWGEPFTPAEINSSEFGVSVRKEGAEANTNSTIDAVRVTVYTTGSVLPVSTYGAGTYPFAPVATPVGKTSIMFYLDAVLHTDAGVVATVNTEISYNSGADWETLINVSGAGGTVAGPSGITEPRWYFGRDLPDPSNVNRQFRGSLVVSGGSLFTSIGVFIN